MVKAFLASTNQHKVEEIRQLVSSDVLELSLPPEKLDVVENGEDFHANALLKAKAYYDKFGIPSLADDSGIVVDALPDELGVKSARFGGEDLPSDKKNELLLKKLEGVKNRKAYYVCVLCLYLNDQEQFFFEGRLHGNINHAPEGDDGFGYDPLFVAEGQSSSIATMGEWKAEHSHRAKACKQMEKFLQGHEK
jgi:XTP/dITP diphosphohydrolase